MTDFDPDAPRVPVRLARSISRAERRGLERRSGGSQLRVRPGTFADRGEWEAGSSLTRYLARIDAVVGTRNDRPVLGYESAAAIWGLPRIGRWPETVHLMDERRTEPHSPSGVVWHRSPVDESEIVSIGPYRLTDIGRTLIDIARLRDLAGATVALDQGLASERVRVEDLVARLAAAPNRRGRRRAQRAIAFADGRAQSPGESLSRVRMHELGFPVPGLQTEFPWPGGTDVVDFDWPELGFFGEFDGWGKYVRTEYTGGRSIEEVVRAERERENRIRRHRPFGVRWGWEQALEPSELLRVLLAAGLPRRAR